jgi:hypothetical protein
MALDVVGLKLRGKELETSMEKEGRESEEKGWQAAK